jgi:hypothetical protein
MMKRMITSMAAALLLIGCGGGDTPAVPKVDTPATIQKGIIDNMNAMAAVFNSISDEASAKTAVPKINEIRANMRGVAARAKAMPKLSPAEMAKFDAEAAKAMPAIMQTMGTARMNLEGVFEKNPEVRKIIEPALADMDKDM